uniref:Uncharacterized protein n=1 Tax=Rhizophora mucronata TaxID=61149 RepID=A0A2P2P460_RHIMU
MFFAPFEGKFTSTSKKKKGA